VGKDLLVQIDPKPKFGVPEINAREIITLDRVAVSFDVRARNERKEKVRKRGGDNARDSILVDIDDARFSNLAAFRVVEHHCVVTSGWRVTDNYPQIWVTPFTDQISISLSFLRVDTQPAAESKDG
jgi:hypothetical protein